MIFLRYYISLLCAVLAVLAGSAQAPRISWYSVNEGLSQSMVTCFYRDHSGLMWIGTGDGLNSFDGTHFVKYRKNLPNSKGMENSTIRQITQDPEGRLWVVTDLHLYRYLREEQRFEKMLPELRAGRILSFRNGEACIWVNQRGLLFYDLKNNRTDTASFFPYQPEVGSYDAFEHPVTGEVYIAAGSGLWKIQPQRGKPCRPVPVYNGPVKAVINLNRDTWWAAGDTLVRKDNSGRIIKKTLPLKEEIFSLLQADERHVLLGTAHSLFEYDITSDIFTRIEAGNQKQQVKALWKDNDGNTWLATDGKGFGIWSVSGNKFIHYNLKGQLDDVPNSTFGIVVSRGRIWSYVYERGIVVTDMKGTLIREIRGPSDAFIPIRACMKLIGNNIYVGGSKGLYLVDQENFTVTQPALSADTVYDMAALGNALYTFGRDIKEYQWIKGKLTLAGRYPNHPFIGKTRHVLADEKEKKLWICDGYSLFSFDAGSKNFARYRMKNGFPRILFFTRSEQGKFVLATYNGIYVFRADSLEGQPVRHALRGEIIYGIIPDGEGRLWCPGNSGIFLLNKSYKTLHHFDMADGLQSLEFNSRGYFDAGDGNLLFGGINGINSIDTKNLRFNQRPPVVMVRRLFIDDRLVENGQHTQELELKHRENVFAAEIVAPDYTAPEKVRYRYKLEGWDENWSEISPSNHIRYVGTNPGHYKLYARACNADGYWSQPVLLYKITILPAWWQTLWFRLSTAVAILTLISLGVWAVARRRMQKQLEQMERKQMLELERSRISRDMHDDLGAELTKINIMSKNMLNLEKAEPENLRKIAETSGKIIGNMREIIWALNAGNDNMGITLAYLREYASEYLEQRGIGLHFRNSVKQEEWQLSAAVRRNMMLIYKEALHNITKHSGATEVSIEFALHDSWLSMKIRDNGKGFEQEKTAGFTNGMMNMRSRSAEINARLRLESMPGEGTKLELNIPLGNGN